jgi:hypothetical protein
MHTKQEVRVHGFLCINRLGKKFERRCNALQNAQLNWVTINSVSRGRHENFKRSFLKSDLLV